MDNIKVANTIKNIRKKYNLTQKELADNLGVTYQAVSKWERGLNLPDISIMKDICNKYNIDIDELLDTSKKKNRYPLIIVLIIILIIFLLTFITLQNKNDFKHELIDTTCEDFKVTGSIAYNKYQTSIMITNVNYCDDDVTVYKEVTCTLYKIDGDKIIKLSTYDTLYNTTLKQALDEVNFKVDSSSSECNYIKDVDFKIVINAMDENNKNYTHDIPLIMTNDCE